MNTSMVVADVRYALPNEIPGLNVTMVTGSNTHTRNVTDLNGDLTSLNVRYRLLSVQCTELCMMAESSWGEYDAV